MFTQFRSLHTHFQNQFRDRICHRIFIYRGEVTVNTRGFDCGEEKEGSLIYSTKTEFIKNMTLGRLQR